MDYQHHIFVSYCRSDDEWVRWTRENFVRPLRTLLRPALVDARIFFDEQIETGADWPTRLAQALARSRLLIPILSRAYFSSDWCRLEFALMYHREKQSGLRTPGEPAGLILPVVIDDGTSFPSEVQAMKSLSIHDFANPFILSTSPRQEQFSEILRSWCPCVEEALERTPKYDPEWERLAYNQFRDKFRIQSMSQTTLPGLSLAPAGGLAPLP